MELSTSSSTGFVCRGSGVDHESTSDMTPAASDRGRSNPREVGDAVALVPAGEPGPLS